MGNRILKVALICLLCLAVTIPSTFRQMASAQVPRLFSLSSGALLVEVANERFVGGLVVADVTLRNLEPTWYTVRRSGGNFIIADQIPMSFVIGPLQTLTFSQLHFGGVNPQRGVNPQQGDFLDLYADRDGLDSTLALALDIVVRGIGGTRLRSFSNVNRDTWLAIMSGLSDFSENNLTLLGSLVADILRVRSFIDFAHVLRDIVELFVHNTQRLLDLVLLLQRAGTLDASQAQELTQVLSDPGLASLVNILLGLRLIPRAFLLLELTTNHALSSRTGFATITLIGVQQLTRFVVAPSSATIAVGERVTITASGNIPVNPTWTVDPPSLGTLSSIRPGQVEFVARQLGDVSVTARQGGFPATSRITVTSGLPTFPTCQLTRITVSPGAITLSVGASQVFVAIGTCTDGRGVPINPTWSVTGGIGTVSPSTGTTTILTATGAGTGAVQASAQGFSASASVQVTGTAAVGTITEFPIPTADGAPVGITGNPFDNNVWFTEFAGNKIGRMTGTGAVTEFPNGSGPNSITFSGADFWFTEGLGGRIGRITSAGIITYFQIPTPSAGPNDITPAPDGTGNLWFTMGFANKIGRITGAGVITEFPIPTTLSNPAGISPGSDAALWFAEVNANKIGRITPAGVFTEFPIPTPASQPFGIALGPDGNVWFTEHAGNKVGRITPSGVITEFPIPTPASHPVGITTGPDGNLWFTESDGNRIGRFNPRLLVFNEFPIPTPNSGAYWIKAARDGNVWFSEPRVGKIGRVTP